MAKISPTESRVLVRHLNETTTGGGIILPTTTKTLLTEAIIVAAGPGKVSSSGVRLPMSADLKIGSKVLVRTSSGIDLGDDVRLIEDSEILGFVD